MHALEAAVLNLANSVPLELFVTLGSFLEEVIAPIPSPSIMLIAGSFGVAQGYSYAGLAMLVMLASIGKTLGGLTMYFIAGKVKDIALKTFGRSLDVTEDDIHRFSGKFTGSWRDYFVYIFFRSVPIIPSILLSFGSGVIHLPLRLFIIGTFVGTIFRDTFYIIVGYAGTEMLYRYLESTSHTESLIQYIVGGFLVVGIIGLFVRKKLKQS
jgi:membrane protein DedA with SNARE-associated domain